MRIESLPHFLPRLKSGNAFFGIGIGAPVRGLRQVRAFQTLTENVPNPRSSIRLPQANVAAISSNIVSTIFTSRRLRILLPYARNKIGL